MADIDLENTKAGMGFWESDQAMKYNQERLGHLDWDKLVNEKLYEIAKEGNVVFDSWTMPWMYPSGFKIWLKVSLEERINRMMGRDGFSYQEARERIEQKEKQTTEIFKKAFGFEFGKDMTPFHAVIDTTPLAAAEVLQTVWAITPIYLKKVKS